MKLILNHLNRTKLTGIDLKPSNVLALTIYALFIGLLCGCQSAPLERSEPTASKSITENLNDSPQQDNQNTKLENADQTTQSNTAEQSSEQKIAVLLNNSSRFKTASAAIRKGILLSYYQQAQLGSTPELIFFDTGNTPVTDIYQQAVSTGAKIVIGPLDKDQVKQLATIPTLTKPVVALNYLPETMAVSSAQLFQFGLASEDEARQISTRAQELGYRRAALLYPQNEWGQRVANAFQDHWERTGGSVSSERSYSTSSDTDYADPVRNLLGVHKKTDANGKSQQTRRQDIDFIVMICDHQIARQLKPMLNYYYANDLPVFSTSNIFSGMIDPNKDQDINGVQFIDLPWVMNNNDPLKQDYLRQPSAVDLASQADTQRLVALGIDSLRIALRLNWLQENVDHHIVGATGKLSLSPGRRVQRLSTWSQFIKGEPIPIVLDIDKEDGLGISPRTNQTLMVTDATNVDSDRYASQDSDYDTNSNALNFETGPEAPADENEYSQPQTDDLTNDDAESIDNSEVSDAPDNSIDSQEQDDSENDGSIENNQVSDEPATEYTDIE